MALIFRALYRNSRFVHDITRPVTRSYKRFSSVRVLGSGVCYKPDAVLISFTNGKQSNFFTSHRLCSTQGSKDANPQPNSEPKKQGLIQRFKEMYRDYWYVLLPVHMTTSAIWFGGFYYAVRSGVDVIGLLESLNLSEKIMVPLKESSAGYFALAFALYKLVTPLRYAVTVGGTTYAIKRLTALGWIRPVPSRERIKEMLQEKKDNIQERISESKQHYQSQIKEKGTQVMDEMRRYKTEMRNMKNKVKKM